MSAYAKISTFVEIFDGMRFISGLIVSFLLIGLFGCTTNFDINATKQDITVVYGLLSQNDSTQYVKVTKAFLGDVSAYQLAQDPSQSSYGDDIDVKIIETTNGNTSRTFTLQKTTITNKDTGIFYAPNQEVYFFKPVPLLNSLSTYKIIVTNNKTKKVTTATTNLVNTFSIQQPSYNPVNPILGLVNQSEAYVITDVKWKSAESGRLYEPYFRFHYKEVDKVTLDSVDKFVDWYMSSVKSAGLSGNEDLLTSYNSESFYKYLQSVIAVNTNVDRVVGKIDFIIAVGGDDLSIYIDLNQPSTTIIQERPPYTNVANGIGIFSCRYSKKISFNLSPASIDKLINGEYTVALGFK